MGQLIRYTLRALPRSAAVGVGLVAGAWLFGFCVELIVDFVLDRVETYEVPRPDVSTFFLLLGAVVGPVTAGVLLVRAVAAESRAARPREVRPGRVGGPGPIRPAPEPPATVDDVPVTGLVADALHDAAGQLAPGADLTTGRVLVALVRLDYRLDWQRIWLVTGAPEQTGLASADDSPPASAVRPDRTTWREVRLSPELTEAFEVAGAVRRRYGYPTVDTAIFTLGLLAFRNAGATRALLSLGQVDHGRLLGHVQDDLLRTRLRGLRAIIPAAPN
ncbi:hypothetical protein GCM10009539_38230 [Cryptosporangium japonicum]|uniref:Uncharacterized protein n=1 Tax=Cryptosporangium japonicum TaxID=80872 RepID=A0ABP3E0Z1_9ACTN